MSTLTVFLLLWSCSDSDSQDEIDLNSTVEFSQNKINVPAEGGKYTITISPEMNYYLEAPEVSSETTSEDDNLELEPDRTVISEETVHDLYEIEYSSGKIDYEVSIDVNKITITVNPAQFRKESSTHFYVYNKIGAIVGTVKITQAGDIYEQIPNLGEDGKSYVRSYGIYLYQALSNAYTLEKDYLENKRAISDTEVRGVWECFYICINAMCNIKDVDESMGAFYQDFCNAHLAMVYMCLSSLWGGIPYFTTTPTSNYKPSKTPETELLSLLADSVVYLLPNLEEKLNNSRSDENSLFFVSKDVARIVLAQIYCNQKKYDMAKDLLDNVVSNGYYSLIQGENVYEDNSESILGLLYEDNNITIYLDNNEFVPCLDYKDVLLTLAECEYHIGNTSIAQDRVNEVAQSKNISLEETEILNMIAETRIKLDIPNTLVFLRRNSLGSYIGLNSDTMYQLLWPIPLQELRTNPNMTQNPGY